MNNQDKQEGFYQNNIVKIMISIGDPKVWSSIDQAFIH